MQIYLLSVLTERIIILHKLNYFEYIVNSSALYHCINNCCYDVPTTILFPSCCSEYNAQNAPRLFIGHTVPITHNRMCHRSMYPPPDHLTLRKSVIGRDFGKTMQNAQHPYQGGQDISRGKISPRPRHGWRNTKRMRRASLSAQSHRTRVGV